MTKNIDINKIVVSNEVSFGKKDFKYFIGHKDATRSRPSCILFSEMSPCRRNFDKTKGMYFLIKDEKLLEKHNEIWKKISSIIKKEFDSKPLYSKKYLITKIKSYNDNINANFQNNMILKKSLNVFVYQ